MHNLQALANSDNGDNGIRAFCFPPRELARQLCQTPSACVVAPPSDLCFNHCRTSNLAWWPWNILYFVTYEQLKAAAGSACGVAEGEAPPPFASAACATVRPRVRDPLSPASSPAPLTLSQAPTKDCRSTAGCVVGVPDAFRLGPPRRSSPADCSDGGDDHHDADRRG